MLAPQMLQAPALAVNCPPYSERRLPWKSSRWQFHEEHMKKTLTVVLTVCIFAVNGYSYGPRGHQLVGAIADKRLAKNPTAAAKVKNLLDGLTLAQASVLPDSIKGWDGCRGTAGTQPVTSKTRINAELRAFLQANLCSSDPSHHEFHYTDVPVFADEDYDDGPVGRGDFDIVKMIPFCIRVLKNQEPQPNPRAITKSVAVVLLAHYFGDIHQPLHVGAQFFDSNGKPFQPTSANHGFEDQGGNKLILSTLKGGVPVSAGKFHGYWDGQTVTNAFGNKANSTIAQELANKEPANWKLTGGVETWAEQLANQMLPVARSAHRRLEFQEIKIKIGERDILRGDAVETRKTDGKFYAHWAAETVKNEIHKGGWRLAALLEEIL